MKTGLKSGLAVISIGVWVGLLARGMELIGPAYGMWGVGIFSILYLAVTVGIAMAALDIWANKE